MASEAPPISAQCCRREEHGHRRIRCNGPSNSSGWSARGARAAAGPRNRASPRPRQTSPEGNGWRRRLQRRAARCRPPCGAEACRGAESSGRRTACRARASTTPTSRHEAAPRCSTPVVSRRGAGFQSFHTDGGCGHTTTTHTRCRAASG
eukprot:3367849-Prymnesium_polylepis.1